MIDEKGREGLIMLEWKDLIIAAIAVIGTLGGAYISGHFSIKSQYRAFSKQMEWDKEKEQKADRITTLEAYSEILEIAGKLKIIQLYEGYEHGYDGLTMNLVLYEEEVRPLLYKRFYQLDQDVALSVKAIDADKESYILHNDAEFWQIERTAEEYQDLIQKIELHLENHRKGFK